MPITGFENYTPDFGIEPGSPLGRGGEAILGGLKGAGSYLNPINIYKALAKAPTTPIEDIEEPTRPSPPDQFTPTAGGPPQIYMQPPSANQPPSRGTFAPAGGEYRAPMQYEGPQLNPEEALAGLAGMEQHPLLALMRLASERSMTGRPQDLASASGIDEYVKGQLAPQRQQLGVTESAIAGLHPAVQAVQEAEARRKAYPQAAYASGLAEQAEIGAEADLQQAMIEAAQGNTESLRQLLPPALEGLVDIASGPDPDSPEAQRAWDLIWSFISAIGQKGNI